MKRIISFLFEEWLCWLSLSTGLVLWAIAGGSIENYISKHDIFVLLVLSVMMLIGGGLRRSGILHRIAYSILRISRGSIIPLLILTAAASALITNDVTIWFVGTLLMVISKNPMPMILAAAVSNLGSMLTPFGNPQNIYIYSYYHLSFSDVFFTNLIPALIGILTIVLVAYRYTTKLTLQEHVEFKPVGIIYLLAFLPATYFVIQQNVLGVSAILTALLAISAIWWREPLQDIDIYLLLTFVGFFFIGGALSRMYDTIIASSTEVFLLSSVLSELLGNVPAATVLADFTSRWKALLLGVSVSGIGSLQASMVNIIAYRLFIRAGGNSKNYLIAYHLLGISLWVGLMAISLLLRLYT